MDNQNTLWQEKTRPEICVLILVLMDNQNTFIPVISKQHTKPVLILVLMDNQNTKFAS